MLGKFFKSAKAHPKPDRDNSASQSTATDPRKIADLAIADGNRAEESGDLAGACALYRKAVEADPSYPKAHLNLGIGLEAVGDLANASAAYQAAVDLDPADPMASYNLGRCLFSANDLARAEPLLRSAIQLHPEFADARVVLARVLENRRDLAGAAGELERVLETRPDYFGALCNYSGLLLKLDRRDDAEAALRRALALEPAHSDLNFKLAMLLSTAGRRSDAEPYFRRALKSNPDSLEARIALVNISMERNDLEAAANHAEFVLKHRPDWLDLLYDYGLILKRMGRMPEAEATFRRALQLDPGYVRAYQMLGAVLISQCRVHEALEVFASGKQHCVDTFDLDSPELFALNFLEEISVDEIFARHRDFGRRIEQAYANPFARFRNGREKDKRLRIGYVSADFQQHVVPLFLLPLLEKRDREAFEVFCYATGDTSDGMTDRLRGLADTWRSMARVSPEEVAKTVHEDGIDILIDLAGHSGVPNLRVFAQRPAPVQATWVGYLNTTGLSRIDYRISDRQCDPVGLTDRYHTEKLVRLPNSQWCYRPFEDVVAATEAPVEKNGFVTFGSFNQTVKISQETRKLWGSILQQEPASRLVVVGVVDNRAREDLLADLGKAGVDPGRVTLAPYLPIADYYRWYAKVDIALDTMPFSGGTTTCDSLWMGVPVVTAPGIRPWSRSASSALKTLGMDDWIADSPEDYVRRALRFAREPSTIASLRKSLRSKMLASPLMDARSFARDMERAYRDMWQTWCNQAGER